MSQENEEKEESVTPLHPIQAQFKNPELERQFRLHFLESEKIQLKLAIWVYLIPNLIFSYSDHILFGFSRDFYTLLTVRGIHILLSIILVMIVSRLAKPQILDISVLVWWASIIALVFFINSTRPAEYLHHSVIDILILFTIYILVSNRLIFQVFPALLLSIGNIVFLAIVKSDMSTMAFNVMWGSYLVGNMLGIVISWRLNASRRLQFNTLQKEKHLRENQERALSEVKTLRGIIPICSQCKKIRDDDGFWQKVEVFVTDHSEADFSHSLCPECVKEIYPALYEKLKKENKL